MNVPQQLRVGAGRPHVWCLAFGMFGLFMYQITATSSNLANTGNLLATDSTSVQEDMHLPGDAGCGGACLLQLPHNATPKHDKVQPGRTATVYLVWLAVTACGSCSCVRDASARVTCCKL